MGDLSIELDVSDLKKLQTDIENVVKTVTKSGEGSVIAKAALVVERQAKINASGRPGPNVITGRLRASIIPHIISYTEATVGTNVEYACVVGSRHQVYEPLTRTAANIGNYPFETILSKDGTPHKIEQRHRFLREPIACISIKTRQGRNPLLVTKDHLILIIREGKVIWQRADGLNSNDRVFGKRSHNAITDNSNKTSYLCYCGTIFWVNNSELHNGERKYCSLDCRHKYGPHDQNTGMHWHLTDEQREHYAEVNRGENNPNWRDGASQLPYDFRFNGILKDRVKERDGYCCQYCGTPFDLVVHHRDWNKMNSNIDNLVTLCRSCHGKLMRQDCELPEVNVNAFVPKPILELDSLVIKRKYKESIPYLYDFTINNENSFMVGGLLVHNSFVEFGHLIGIGIGSRGGLMTNTSKMTPFHMGQRRTNAYPFLYPAIDQCKNELEGVFVSFSQEIEGQWQ